MHERYLVSLLVKLAASASIASVLARSNRFKSALMQERRSLSQRISLALWLGVVFGASVAARVVSRNLDGADLGLEGSLLAGLLGGYVTGLCTGVGHLDPGDVPLGVADHAAFGRHRRARRAGARWRARSRRTSGASPRTST